MRVVFVLLFVHIFALVFVNMFGLVFVDMYFIAKPLCRQMQFELRVDIHSNEITRFPDERLLPQNSMISSFEMSFK